MSAPPPTLVTVEVVDACWLVWDVTRGHWTLRAPAPGLALEARVLAPGTHLTLVWPEPR